MNNFSRYYKAVHFLEGLSNMPLQGDYMIDRQHLGAYLERMRYFLNLLGNPDAGMKFIHIAGTAGKGSVTNMTHEILNAAGKNAGSFTSPFVTTTIEKIKVGDAYISPDEFADIVDHLKPYIDEAYLSGPYGRPSYFEICLAIALIHFRNRKCEWIVLEVGLGGRYDATNVITNPVVTAITNIDYDHTEILGKTLTKIARDKAGIIKPGSVFLTTEQRPALLTIFQDICDDKKVMIQQLGYCENYEEYNKSLAKNICMHLRISEKSVNEGIAAAKLQCRFEIIQDKPLVVLDGAHNRSKIRSTIGNLRKLNYTKLFLVIGIAESKDSRTILKEIVPHADSVYITRFQIRDRKCAHPKELFQRSEKYLKKNSKINIFLDPEMALSHALEKAGPADAVLVVGSFFLAGELRKRWFPEQTILKFLTSF